MSATPPPRAREPQPGARRARPQGGAATRLEVVLCCTECKSRNYKTTKRPDKVLSIRKFCKTCGRHTLHQESK
ncbi:MAG: 50S ribosomal protein L33 [Polyangiaceae bacterium]|nr:50S ribosomal protein L33 [Polyangiaceae bacterium]